MWLKFQLDRGASAQIEPDFEGAVKVKIEKEEEEDAQYGYFAENPKYPTAASLIFQRQPEVPAIPSESTEPAPEERYLLFRRKKKTPYEYPIPFSMLVEACAQWIGLAPEKLHLSVRLLEESMLKIAQQKMKSN